MGLGRDGLPMVASAIGEGKVDQKPRRRKSGGGITNSRNHHIIGKEQILDLHESNGCKNNTSNNNRQIDLDLGNAAALKLSRRLSPKIIAHGLPHSQCDIKQQQKMCEGGGRGGSVTGRRKTRPNVGDGRERSLLNYEADPTPKEVNSPSSVKTTKRKNVKAEVSEVIGRQQPSDRLDSKFGRSARRSRIETVDNEGGDLGPLDTARNLGQRDSCRPHKRKAPEPNVTVANLDLDVVHPSPKSNFDPRVHYTHNSAPISHSDSKHIHTRDSPQIPLIDFEPMYPHSITPIPHFDSELMCPHDLHALPHHDSVPVSPNSAPPFTRSSSELTDPEPIFSPIHHLCLEAPETPVAHSSPSKTHDPHPLTFNNGVHAPEPTKTSPCLSRRPRRTFTELTEEPNRLQCMVDLIMWRDTPKSALLFGFGSFCVLSSSFAQDIHFSCVSFVSYLALIYLAAVFFYKTILRRGAIEQDDNLTNYELISEADALWVLRSTLPTANLLLFNFQKLFSGDPATTMKLASILWVLAKCGNTMTIWTLAKLSFFALFIIPKLYSSYSAQFHGFGCFMLNRFRDAWNTCSHKKAAAIAIFLLLWNFSTVTARLWGAFILIVALRLYQQSLRTEFNDQQLDLSVENIRTPEPQAEELSKLELMRIPQEVF